MMPLHQISGQTADHLQDAIAALEVEGAEVVRWEQWADGWLIYTRPRESWETRSYATSVRVTQELDETGPNWGALSSWGYAP